MKMQIVMQQEETDCGAACLATICKYYGKRFSLFKIRDLMHTGNNGVSMYNLKNCAESLGFETIALKVKFQYLKEIADFPCIANVVIEDINHFIVIYKITEKYVKIGDPADGIKKLELENFKEIYSNYMLLLKPTNVLYNSVDCDSFSITSYVKVFYSYKKEIFLIIFSSFILTLIGVINSKINKCVYDRIFLEGTVELFKTVIFSLLSISLIQILISYIRQWLLVNITQSIDFDLAGSYFEHIIKLPPSFFLTRKIGDLVTRFADIQKVKNILLDFFLSFLVDICMTIFFGILLYKKNVSLFIVITIMTLANIIIMMIYRESIRNLSKEQFKQVTRNNSMIIEDIKNIESIKCNCYEKVAIDKIKLEYQKALKIEYRRSMIINRENIVVSLVGMGYNIAFLYICILQVANGKMTLGDMAAFSTLASYFIAPLNRIVGIHMKIQEMNISLERLSEIIQCKEEDLYSNTGIEKRV